MINKVLGRGISSLIDSNSLKQIHSNDVSQQRADYYDNVNEKIIDCPIYMIKPNVDQPRSFFDDERLEELTISIKNYGILQPIIVKKNTADEYEIIAGERRWRAAKRLNIKTIPVIIKNIDEATAKSISLIENIQREDLNPLEEAKSYVRLIENYNYTQEKLAELLGKSRSHISNTIRILNLPNNIQKMLQHKVLSLGHAKLLINNDNALEIAEEIVKKKLSVRDSEKLIKHTARKKNILQVKNTAFKSRENQDFSEECKNDLKAISQTLENLIGAKVSVDNEKITIYYNDASIIDEIIKKLGNYAI
jgi:ParB family chromosome partitioning protein